MQPEETEEQKQRRAMALGVSLGVNWDVLSKMLGDRSASCEVQLSAFEFLPAGDGWPRRFIVNGRVRISE